MINLPFFKKQSVKTRIPFYKEVEGFDRIKELISPPGAEFFTDYFRMGSIYGRTFLILEYPSFLFSGWLAKVINLDEIFNIGLYFKPLETALALKQLEKQLARVQVQIYERGEAGKVRSPELEAAYRNVEDLRDLLIQAQEKMLQVSKYITIFAKDKKELDQKTSIFIKIFESNLITAKVVLFQQMEGFLSTTSLGTDEVQSSYHLNSSTAASFFPFISSEIVDDSGVFFGVNLQNAGFVILDRWKYENAHSVVLARAGSGKSYSAKLEVMRNLMMGTDVLILDPENEYRSIAEIYGGSFISFSLKREGNINPFDLPPVLPNEEPFDVYKEHVSDLVTLCQLIMEEKLSPEDLAILDQAINQTYASFNILPEKNFSQVKNFPTFNDLERVLGSLVGGQKLANKLYPYTQGNFSGFINKPSSIELDKRLIVFGFKDLPEILRHIGMFVALNYIFTRIRREIKKRLVIVDEAWWLIRQEFAAEFLLNAVKRGRKYSLALTNITQDVEDFLNSPYGKPIITNSALAFLLKQSPATINLCGQTFALSQGEKQFLLQAERGEGLLIVGNKKVPLYVLASYAEDQIIRTRPEQLFALIKAKESLKNK